MTVSNAPISLNPVDIAKEKAKLNLVGWITVTEAAEMLKLTPRRVRNFLSSGRLPAMRVGRTWFIERSDVLEFSQIKRRPGRPVYNEGKK